MSVVLPGLESVPRAGGRLRGLQRWFAPQSFVGWTESAAERYVMELPLAPPVLLTCSPADCRAVFTERDGALLFGEGLRRFAPHEAMFGHDAIAALDGEDHTRFRRQLTAAFHGEALKGYEEGIVAVTERRIAQWPLGRPVPFAELTHELARDIIATTVFGVTQPDRARRLGAALDRLDGALNSLELAGRFAAAIVMRGWWAPYPRIHAIHAEIAAIAREEIAERRAAPPDTARRDCLARFLAHDEGAISDDEIVSALHVLVVAGWATTATTLAWLAERLARHPEALAGCRRAAAEGDPRYLVAAVQETLRMRPPVPVTLRYAARDFDLGDLRVPRGAMIAADIERMHHRADLYPEPRRFRPERFLEHRPGTYTWIPFGGGVHRCLGAGFALTEARLILQAILRHLTFAREESRGEPSLRRTLVTMPRRRATVTLVPAQG
ncbi:MAG TPA: cytochrome P450 [Solirubrobacteraceae bacterium]|nr:cytochrome P450 [Solirubrobacteraceae bacterium]